MQSGLNVFVYEFLKIEKNGKATKTRNISPSLDLLNKPLKSRRAIYFATISILLRNVMVTTMHHSNLRCCGSPVKNVTVLSVGTIFLEIRN
jgi:hypothetical protein